MRWEGGRQSDNVEDRRGGGGGGGGGLPVGGRSIGLGTIIMALAAWYFFGVDPTAILNQGVVEAPTQAPPQQQSGAAGGADDEMGRFVSVVLGDTEDTWKTLFRQAGKEYREPRLVLYSGATRSACGVGQAAMGPFYCPADEKVYLDLAFFRELQQRFRAPGDFAQAYVIAHEIGHHVQHQLGISEKVEAAQRRGGQAQANALSIRLELQADCLAGVWAHHANQARNILEQGDIEEALTAAAAIGDDRLQKQAQGYAVPDSFTHGSSEQRVRWFRRGIQSGSFRECDTFSSRQL